jgi:uncharacterized protein (DUF2141 family)
MNTQQQQQQQQHCHDTSSSLPTTNYAARSMTTVNVGSTSNTFLILLIAMASITLSSAMSVAIPSSNNHCQSVDSSTIATPTAHIHVPLHKLRNHGKGTLFVGLFDRHSAINKKGRIGVYDMSKASFYHKLDVTSSTMDVTFADVPHGEYSVMAYHDMTDDGQLSSNFLGIPTEDLCMSNNAKGGPMGAPKWEDAKFDHVCVSREGESTCLEPMEMVHFHKGK